MAKDNRTIKSNIRLDRQSYGPGREDELEQLLTPERGAQLVASGALEGNWNFGGGTTSEETAGEETADAEANANADSGETGEGETGAAATGNTDTGSESALDAEIVEKLSAAFASPDDVAAASDEEILAIDGIGKKTLEKIRAAFPKSE